LTKGEKSDSAGGTVVLLSREGASAQAIRPPTVPPGTSRLRLTTMATHRIADLRRAAGLIGNAARDLGLSAPPARDLPMAA
jgi:7-keto-8-aminopelargonate synthetase-like enzyme